MTALFDFDGVIMDTESQYTKFWDEKGKELLGREGFGHTIKGQTLKQIFGKYFTHCNQEELSRIERMIDSFEADMKYEFIPGVVEFLAELKRNGIPCAIVTSSNNKKMDKVYKIHPELKGMVDAVLTSENFSRSKPDPECFLKGMEALGGCPQDTVVFEDSLHGIEAGRQAGAFVVGLATTNSREKIMPLCDAVIDNFKDMTLERLKTL